jgi:hypothetical protein
MQSVEVLYTEIGEAPRPQGRVNHDGLLTVVPPPLYGAFDPFFRKR